MAAEGVWYKSKKGWVTTVLGAVYFVLDHWGRAEVAHDIYNFLSPAKKVFPVISSWIPLVFFLSALAFFEAERRKRQSRPPNDTEGVLRITSAAYGVGDGRYKDVTNQVRAHLKNNKIKMLVSNNTLMGGADPFYGEVKHLMVEYSVDNGPIREIVRRELDHLELPEGDERKTGDQNKPTEKSWADRMSDEDSENMSKRLISCGVSARLDVDTVEPYIDVTFKLVNASLFGIMTDAVEGNATYLDYSSKSQPFSRIPQIVNPPFTLSHGGVGELKLRQFVPSSLTDNIASGGGKIKIDFSLVQIWFVFPGTGRHNRFCWWGDEVEVAFPN
jgi:hypothetical protein